MQRPHALSGRLALPLTIGAGVVLAALPATPGRPVQEPFPETGAIAPPGEAPPRYVEQIAPIFATRCMPCHGATRPKAGLSLHEPRAILRGSRNGPVVIPGRPGESEVIRRLRLPLDHDDHMPPVDAPQPVPEEIDLIESWIAAGAPVERGAVAAVAALAGEAGAPEPQIPPASPDALARLRERLVHVEAVARGSNLLWIDCAAAAQQVTDEEAFAWLEPVREQVEALGLARCAIGGRTLALLARMPNLRRLDVRGSAIADADLAPLRGHARLEKLVATHTRVTDAAVEHLGAMPALRRLYLWKTGLSADGLARLRAQRPDLVIDVGEQPGAAALETEPEIALSSDAPLPGDAPGSAPADALKPINTVCPVSGTPVDPRYAIVHRGRVIGFCCPNCPVQFWSDPAKFEAALTGPVKAPEGSR